MCLHLIWALCNVPLEDDRLRTSAERANTLNYPEDRARKAHVIAGSGLEEQLLRMAPILSDFLIHLCVPQILHNSWIMQ